MFLATVSLVGCIQGLLVYISVKMWHVVTVSVEQRSSAGGQTLFHSTRNSTFAAFDIFHTCSKWLLHHLL